MRGFAPWPGGVIRNFGARRGICGGACGRAAAGSRDNFGGEGFGESGLWQSSQLEITSVKQEGRKEISRGSFCGERG